MLMGEAGGCSAHSSGASSSRLHGARGSGASSNSSGGDKSSNAAYAIKHHSSSKRETQRRTWARRHKDAARVHGCNLLHCLLIVGEHNVLAAQVAQVLQAEQMGRPHGRRE